MKPKTLLIGVLGLAMATCMPKQPDPADLYVGTWDCQSAVTESGVAQPRSFRELPVVEITKLDPSNVRISFPDSTSLQMNAELVNRKLVIRRQETYLYATGRYNGRVTVLGDGDFNTAKLTLNFTATSNATGGVGYARAVQLAGAKR